MPETPPKCVMCDRPVGVKAQSYEPTEEEKHVFKVLLQEEGPTVFCRACDHLSKDAPAFAEFMKGVWLTKMRIAGVPLSLAEERANKAYDFFISKAKVKPTRS